MTFTLPSGKINELLADMKNILIQNVLTPKQLAKRTGNFHRCIYSLFYSGKLRNRTCTGCNNQQNIFSWVENWADWSNSKQGVTSCPADFT